MHFLPGSGAGGSISISLLGTLIIGTLLLITLNRRRTFKGVLQVILFACVCALLVFRVLNQTGILMVYVEYLVISFGALSYFISQANENI